MNEFSTIILPGVGGKGFAKAKNNPVYAARLHHLTHRDVNKLNSN